jgi:hypothetical protein
LDVILAHAGPPLPGGELRWQVIHADGSPYAAGIGSAVGPLSGGRPQSLMRITFDAPHTTEALTLRFEAVLETAGRLIQNSWPLWVFPVVAEWPPDIGLLDPLGSLTGLDDLWSAALRLDRPASDIGVLLTTVLTDEVLGFLRDGGSVLLLQHGDRPLPVVNEPFWRVGIKLIGDHPVMNAFPHNGFVDLQFSGLATDWVLDTGRLPTVLPDVANVRPLLRRLHTAQFTVADYLIEAQVGSGRLIASTLRFQGGMGDQPVGLRAQVAGRWLLYSLLKSLRRDHGG